MWRTAVKMDAYAKHAELAAALEAQMRAQGQGAGLRMLRQIMMRMVKGEAGMRVEIWRTTMKDEVRAEEMARLQADLEARAADASKGAALRQLRAIMVRIMKGESAMRLEMWRTAVKMDAYARHREVQAALLQQMQDASKAQGLNNFRIILARLVKGEMGMRVAVWRVETRSAVNRRAAEM